MHGPHGLFQTGWVLGLVLSAAAVASAADWPQWRGPRRDGSIPGWDAPAVWPKTLKSLWKVEVGEGHSSPVVAGDRVFLLSRQGENEVVRGLSLADGKELWSHAYPAPFTMSPWAKSHGKGPKSTSLIADGRLVTLGIAGMLSCFDIRTGKLVWQHDSAKQYATKSEVWYGDAMSPVADRGLAIAHVGAYDRGALTAFELASGRIRWRWAGDGPGYASPIVVELAGTRQVITQSLKACIGVSAADGALLWSIPFTTEYDQNIVTPVVAGPLVIFSGTGKGTTAYRLNREAGRMTPRQVWHNEDVSFYMSSPVLVGSRLVGLVRDQKGQFICLDGASGKKLWTSDGRQGDYAVLLSAGNTVLAQTTRGELLVFKADVERFETLAAYKLSDQPTWAQPAVVGRKILVKDASSLALWTLE